MAAALSVPPPLPGEHQRLLPCGHPPTVMLLIQGSHLAPIEMGGLQLTAMEQHPALTSVVRQYWPNTANGAQRAMKAEGFCLNKHCRIWALMGTGTILLPLKSMVALTSVMPDQAPFVGKFRLIFTISLYIVVHIETIILQLWMFIPCDSGFCYSGKYKE